MGRQTFHRRARHGILVPASASDLTTTMQLQDYLAYLSNAQWCLTSPLISLSIIRFHLLDSQSMNSM